jgi:hypothetical protein
VIDDAVGIGNLPQSLAFMAFLAARRFARWFVRTAHPRYFLQPVMDGGLPLLKPSRRSNPATRSFKAEILAANHPGGAR